MKIIKVKRGVLHGTFIRSSQDGDSDDDDRCIGAIISQFSIHFISIRLIRMCISVCKKNIDNKQRYILP